MPIATRIAAAARRAQRGFTLIEMLTTVAVVAVTTTVGVPALTGFVAGNRAAAQINTLIGALNYARSEAVSSARQVSLCPYTENPAASDPALRYTCASVTTWQQGWIVFRTVVDEAGTATGDSRSAARVRAAGARRYADRQCQHGHLSADRLSRRRQQQPAIRADPAGLHGRPAPRCVLESAGSGPCRIGAVLSGGAAGAARAASAWSRCWSPPCWCRSAC